MCVERKPKLIAFDLDQTLWPYWVESNAVTPFRTVDQSCCRVLETEDMCEVFGVDIDRGYNNGEVLDTKNRTFGYFEEVPMILEKLYNEGYVLAVVSRTRNPKGAQQLLDFFNWSRFFTYKEMYEYPTKIPLFERIEKISGLNYSDMINFDDEEKNYEDLRSIGIKTKLVHNGVTADAIEKGLQEFANDC